MSDRIIDIASYNSMPTLERATLIHKVWTEKGFKAPTEIIPNQAGIEGALGYLKLIIAHPDSPRIEGYFTMATTLIQLWVLADEKSRTGQPLL